MGATVQGHVVRYEITIVR